MLFNKIKKTFNVQTIVVSLDYRPLVVVKKPYEEAYPFWQLFYVSRGEMQIERDGKIETVKAGEAVFRPPFKKSTMIYPENAELYVGIIDFICPDDEMSFFGESPIALDAKEKRLITDIIKEASEFYKDCYSNTLWPELISTALENFLIRLYGRMNGIFASVDEINKANTQNNISETVDRINLILEERRFSSVTVDEIASILNESPNVLMKRYKKEMHESIIDHYLGLKLQTAIQLINSSDMNFTEISELLGFSSVNYFSKFFKKRTGMTPTEYSRGL